MEGYSVRHADVQVQQLKERQAADGGATAGNAASGTARSSGATSSVAAPAADVMQQLAQQVQSLQATAESSVQSQPRASSGGALSDQMPQQGQPQHAASGPATAGTEATRPAAQFADVAAALAAPGTAMASAHDAPAAATDAPSPVLTTASSPQQETSPAAAPPSAAASHPSAEVVHRSEAKPAAAAAAAAAQPSTRQQSTYQRAAGPQLPPGLLEHDKFLAELRLRQQREQEQAQAELRMRRKVGAEAQQQQSAQRQPAHPSAAATEAAPAALAEAAQPAPAAAQPGSEVDEAFLAKYTFETLAMQREVQEAAAEAEEPEGSLGWQAELAQVRLQHHLPCEHEPASITLCHAYVDHLLVAHPYA